MDNFHEKILKREDGSQVKIETNLYLESARYKELIYKHAIFTREKGKRKWIHVPSQQDGTVNEIVSSVVKHSEIWEAQKEFWNSIKPKFPENHE